MPRQNTIRPANANYQDLLVDFTGWDFSQFDGQQEKPQEEPGFLSKLGNSAMAIGEGLTMLPGGVVDTLRDAYHGGNIDVTDADALRERQERERERAYLRKYQGKTFEGLPDAMNSMGYSTATMGASLIAGALGSAAGPVGAGAAGMAASGALAYRASKQQFLRQMLDRTEQVLGRMPTQEEWDRIATEFDDEATKFGAWEAGPEALSNLFMAKLLGPLGKNVFKGGLGNIAKRVGGLYGEELGTETATQMGQGYEEERAGLREKAPGFLEAFGEIAPATFWQTTLMAGGKKGADLLARRFRSRKADVEANAGASAAGQDDTLQSPDISSSAAQSGEFDALSAPAWNPAEPRMDEDIWNREAAARGWNHLRTDVNAAVTPQDASTSRVSAALEQGESVDLLQSDAAPAPAQRQWAAQTPWESPLAVPFPEASSFTMDAMLRPAVMPARPASNAFLSDAEHADSENFVRKFEEQERLEGDKAMSLYGPMSRMRESYPVSRGVLSQMGQQAMPLVVATANPTAAAPVPTQAQITNTQTAPRADTMAQAEILGMPAPDAVPQEAQATRAMSVVPSPMPGAMPDLGNQMQPMPVLPSPMPRGLPAPVEAVSGEEKPLDRKSRLELIRSLPQEERARARKMKNPELFEYVRQRREDAQSRATVPVGGEAHTSTRPEMPASEAQEALAFIDRYLDGGEGTPEAFEAALTGIGKRISPYDKQERLLFETVSAGKSGKREESADARAAKPAGDPLGTAHTQFSGRPAEAIEHLMRVKEGHVPAAFNKEGLGDIDLPWGRDGKKGYGLAHIIERRTKDGFNGEAFARELPGIIDRGILERREEYPGRAYIIDGKSEAVIRLDWSGEKRAWLVTAYPDKGMFDSPSSGRGSRSTRTSAPEKTPSRDLGNAASSISAPAAKDKPATEGRPAAESGPVRPPETNTLPPVKIETLGRISGELASASPAKPEGKSAGNKTGAAPARRTPSSRIEDFGEKIGGARKDVWQGLRAILDSATVEDIARQPLEKAFPAPNYEKLLAEGTDPKLVALTHAMRDYVAARKPKMRTRSYMAGEMKELLDGYRKLLAGETTLQQFYEGTAFIDRGAARGIQDVADLYEAVGHSNSLAGVSISAGSYSLLDGKRYDPPLTMYVVEKAAKATALSNWPRELARGKTREEAIAAFKKKFNELEWDKPKKKKDISFSIYYKRNNPQAIFIGKKIGRDFVDLAGPFATAEEARTHEREHGDELAKKLAEMKELPDERRAGNAPRVGEDLRDGRDVTPEMFSEAFGFRGVEFGNWVGNEQRQTDLNNAFDALMDLAGVLDISPKALSLNGELGLAFGARGRGGKQAHNAHYETGRVVINLTRARGAGSLAHEWLHALDNYFARMRGEKFAGEYLSDDPEVALASRGKKPVHLHKTPRREIIEAWGLVRKAIRESGMKERSDALDKLRTRPYWGTDVEMTARAFESYVIEKLHDQNAANDYLANIVSDEAWRASVREGQGYPYPVRAELPAIRAAFDHLFRTVEERRTERGVALASLATGEYLPPRRDTRLRLRHAAAQRVADALGKTAKNAAPVRVVQHFDELPAGIRKKHAGNAAALEGVYDPATGTVWLVADNLSDAGRVAEVWAHEQIVHHGLRGMLSDTERRTVLNQLWLNLGGMGNAAISEVAKRYGLNPRSDSKARLTVMEEVLANLAEKRQMGSLDATEQGAWRKIVNAILRAWNRLVQAVSGRSARMGHGNVDALLADLGRYVMEGVPVGKGGRTGEKAAFASVSEDRETTGRAAWEQVKKDTEAWGRQLDDFAAGRGNKIRGLTVGTTPDVLRRLGAKPLPIEMARRNLTKVLTKHEVPLDTLRDLPKHLADPLMVFKSATMSNAYVMLTEMERNGENLVAAIHFDVETGRTRINDIASIHDRSTTRDTGEKVPGWVWIKNQIAAGNLRYYDKTRSSRWFRERAGLQLPSVVNRESYRGVKILTEKDVVKPVAPQEIEEAAHDAWRQIQRDMEEWGRQIDAARNGAIHPRQVLTVGQTPAVLQTLGAPDLAMTMTQNVLRKIGEGGKHGLPDALVRRLPVLLAEPVMVFRSGTQANSLVALLETVHSGMPVVAAVHLDVVRGSVHINELSSVYGKSNGGLGWIANEIRAGRRMYADKTKIPAWRRGFAEDQGSRRMSGLQLPGAFVLPNDPRGVKILTEKDVVKPVAPQEIEEGGSPLASLGKAERVPRAYAESIASGVRQIRKVMGRSVGEDVEEILSNPEMGRLVPKNDLSIFERLFKLPHWIAKGFPSFAKLYDRQQRRSEDSMEATNKALAQMPLLFDADAKKRLEEKEYRQLAAMLNKWDGREIGALHGIEKFNTLGKTLWKDRPVLAHNPRYKEKFDEWLKAQPEPERVKQAFRQVRGALDDAFLAAYSKLAAMSDLADTDLETYRTDFGSIHNYFPHSRKGKYFVTATMGKGIAGDPRQVVFRKHFDVPLGSSVREEWAKIVAANRKDFPGATWNQPQKVEKLPDDILGAPIDVEAMEQLIKAAAGKIGDNEQAQEIQKLMLTGISDILKARGFGAHGIKRQNIPGYETENIKEVLYEYVSGLNGWLTKMEAASDFAAALGKINAQKTPRLWEYASQYVKDMLRNSDQIDRIAGNIKTVAFAWYLGANFKTAVVNATQNAIIGVPRLQMYVTGGGAQWIKGAMDTIGLKYTGTGVRGARNLTADEESMLQELYGNGVISAAYMDELQGQLTSSPVLKGWRRFIAVLGKPMAMVECFNRASLALAAYRAAKAGAFRASALQEFGLKDGEKMNHEQARDFAAMLVRDSHYEYGKGNQPEFLRSNFAGRMASPVYTFRSFGFNTLNLWWRALRQEGWEGRVFVAKSLGATIALGGLTAFPFYATMAALCAAASGDDEDWTSKIRKALPESDLMRDVACYGLPALAGVNIGGSLRMETPFTEGIEKGTTFKEAMTESLGALFGIPYDMAVNKTSKFFEAGKYGDGYKMIEALAPTFVANAMQAYRLATEGQTTIKGRPINSPGQPGARKLSGAEAMGKVLGFQPTSSAKSYEAYRAGKRQDAVRSDKVNDLAVLVLKSIDTGKPDGRIAMMQELRAWNKRMQEEGKPHMLIQPKDVLRRVKSRRRENRATPKQRQKGAAQMATWGV